MNDKNQFLKGLVVAFLNGLTIFFAVVYFTFDKMGQFLLIALCVSLYVWEVYIYKKKIVQKTVFLYGYFLISIVYFFVYDLLLLYWINNSEIMMSVKLSPFVYGYPLLILMPFGFFLKAKGYNVVVKVVLWILMVLVYLFFPATIMTLS
ncbi:MAG: hypothetical protein E7557_01095 [Ruminococcaceae bacterium]|nr:hypothetical protein [Oscillospiraceae bacterium]